MRAIQFEVTEGTLTISAQQEGRGQARAVLAVETEGSQKFKVDFNPDFIVDFLKSLPQGPVVFKFRDASGAGLFQLDNSDDLYVVMPITTS